VSTLIAKVMSPRSGTFRDVAGEGLHRILADAGHDLNAKAAAYVWDLARSLGLITPKNVLSDRGKALAQLARPHTNGALDLNLSPAEQFALFAWFLEADGPTLSLVAAEFASRPRARANMQSRMQEIFREVVEYYLTTAMDIRERATLRREKERLVKDYQGRTWQHKLDVRLMLLVRSRLLEESPADVFSPASEGILRLADLGKDLAKLSQRLDGGHSTEMTADILLGAVPRVAADNIEARELASAYALLVGTSSRFIEVRALCDYIAAMRSSTSVFVAPQSTIQRLRFFAEHAPRSVRFHVDRRGDPTYVALSPELLAS
jgi:hypothetical protein